MTIINDEVAARLADMDKTYWVIIDGVLYTKVGSGALYASAFYPHTDPAGVRYWHRENRTVTTKNEAKSDDWKLCPALPAPTDE